jgi:hypothetical protein
MEWGGGACISKLLKYCIISNYLSVTGLLYPAKILKNHSEINRTELCENFGISSWYEGIFAKGKGAVILISYWS